MYKKLYKWVNLSFLGIFQHFFRFFQNDFLIFFFEQKLLCTHARACLTCKPSLKFTPGGRGATLVHGERHRVHDERHQVFIDLT